MFVAYLWVLLFWPAAVAGTAFFDAPLIIFEKSVGAPLMGAWIVGAVMLVVIGAVRRRPRIKEVRLPPEMTLIVNRPANLEYAEEYPLTMMNTVRWDPDLREGARVLIEGKDDDDNDLAVPATVASVMRANIRKDADSGIRIVLHLQEPNDYIALDSITGLSVMSSAHAT